MGSFILLLLQFCAHAHAMPEFKLDGRVNLDLRLQNRFEDAAFAKEAQLDIETPRYQGLKAGIDFKVSDISDGFDLRELYLNYETQSGNRWELGQAKKSFGLGWDLSQKERLTLERGAVYRKLGTLAYAGRDSSIAFRSGRHDLSLHSSGGSNAAFLYALKHKFDKDSFIASYSLIQADSVDRDWESGGAQGLAYSGRLSEFRLESELFVGKDPIETQLERGRGAPRQVFFSALSLGGSWERFRLAPFAKTAFILHDLSTWGVRTLEATLGFRFHVFQSFQLGAEANLLRSKNRFLSSSHALVSLRYYL